MDFRGIVNSTIQRNKEEDSKHKQKIFNFYARFLREFNKKRQVEDSYILSQEDIEIADYYYNKNIYTSSNLLDFKYLSENNFLDNKKEIFLDISRLGKTTNQHDLKEQKTFLNNNDSFNLLKLMALLDKCSETDFIFKTKNGCIFVSEKHMLENFDFKFKVLKLKEDLKNNKITTNFYIENGQKMMANNELERTLLINSAIAKETSISSSLFFNSNKNYIFDSKSLRETIADKYYSNNFSVSHKTPNKNEYFTENLYYAEFKLKERDVFKNNNIKSVDYNFQEINTNIIIKKDEELLKYFIVKNLNIKKYTKENFQNHYFLLNQNNNIFKNANLFVFPTDFMGEDNNSKAQELSTGISFNVSYKKDALYHIDLNTLRSYKDNIYFKPNFHAFLNPTEKSFEYFNTNLLFDYLYNNNKLNNKGVFSFTLERFKNYCENKEALPSIAYGKTYIDSDGIFKGDTIYNQIVAKREIYNINNDSELSIDENNNEKINLRLKHDVSLNFIDKYKNIKESNKNKDPLLKILSQEENDIIDLLKKKQEKSRYYNSSLFCSKFKNENIIFSHKKLKKLKSTN